MLVAGSKVAGGKANNFLFKNINVLRKLSQLRQFLLCVFVIVSFLSEEKCQEF